MIDSEGNLCSFLTGTNTPVKIVPIRTTLQGVFIEDALTSMGLELIHETKFPNAAIVNETEKTARIVNINYADKNLFEIEEYEYEDYHLTPVKEEVVKVGGLYFMKSDWDEFTVKAIRDPLFFTKEFICAY